MIRIELIRIFFSFVKKPEDHTRFINEDEEEIDELHTKSGAVGAGASDLYNFNESKARVYETKLIRATDSCPCCNCSKRWQLAILANIGFLIVFGIRTNFGAARVRMSQNYTNPLTHLVEVKTNLRFFC